MQRELAGNGAGVQAARPIAERQTASAAILRDRPGRDLLARVLRMNLLYMSDPLRSVVLRGNRIPDNTIICISP